MTRPLVLALLALVLGAPALRAQGLFVDLDRDRRPVHAGSAACLPMTGLDFDVKAREAQVEMTVAQTFRNATSRVLEGVYLFPIPKGAVAANFELWMNGQPVPAEVLKKDQARGVYESIVRRARDPGLLEYVEQDLLRANIFPIEPGKEAKVRMKLVWTAQRLGELFAFDLPLHVPEGDPRVSLKLDVLSAQKLGAVFSPTHALDVVRDGDHHVVASYEGTRGEAGRVRLYYGLGADGPGVSLLCHRTHGPGHFLLTLFAPSADDQPRMPRDVVFVLDRSGSMQDGKLEQAVAALRHGVGSLRKGDRFDVVSFATDSRSVFGGFAEANEENKARARSVLAELQARGGTALAGALEDAVSRPFSADRMAMVVVLTDGAPTIGETDSGRILKALEARNAAGARVFCFGLGHDVNARLLDLLAEGHDGVSDYVLPQEDLEVRVSAFFDRVQEPVLRDVEITIEGVEAHDLFPRSFGALYAGSAVHVLGQYDLSAKGKVILRGENATGAFERRFTLDFPRQSADHESLRPLFASRKVAYLLQQVRKNGLNPELQQEIERLGREYGIVTPWTSALVVEDGEILATRTGRPMPEPSLEAFFGDETIAGGGGARDGALTRPGRSGGRADGPTGPASAGTDVLSLGRRLRAAEARSLEELDRQESGEKAVRLADSLNDLAGNAQGEGATLFSLDAVKKGKDGRSGPRVAHREGRTFLELSGAWVDRSLTAEGWKGRRTVVAFSPEYFALLKEKPALAGVFALGDEVVVAYEGLVYHVMPEEAVPAADAPPTQGEAEGGGDGQAKDATPPVRKAGGGGR